MNEKEYITKQELIYRSEKNIDKLWGKIIKERLSNSYEIPIINKKGIEFWFYDDKLSFQKLKIEKTRKDLKETNIMNKNLIEEAYSSAAIERAVLDKNNLKEILDKNGKYLNEDEKMFVNVYRALEYIINNKNEQIDHSLIYKIHKILLNGFLERRERVPKRSSICTG